MITVLEFSFPWAFLLLPLPLLARRLLPPHREQVPSIRAPFFRRIVQATGSEARQGAVVLRRRRIQGAAAILTWTLLICALARPEQVGEPIEMEKAARDIVLAIDISGSMDANDFVTPQGETIQRLSGVKQVIGEFIRDRQGDRIALIVFGSKAYVQSPFTEDLRTIGELLDQTLVGMAGPHTVIGDAIGLAIRTFENSQLEQRLLILLSDGTDTNSRMSPVNAARIANSNGVDIFTIGVGDPNASGEQKVDLETLQKIAALADGQSFVATDQAALAAVYQRIDAMAPRQVETLSYRPRNSLLHWPLAASALIPLGTLLWLYLPNLYRNRQGQKPGSL